MSEDTLVSLLQTAPPSVVLGYIAFQLHKLCDHARSWHPHVTVTLLSHDADSPDTASGPAHR